MRPFSTPRLRSARYVTTYIRYIKRCLVSGFYVRISKNGKMSFLQNEELPALSAVLNIGIDFTVLGSTFSVLHSHVYQQSENQKTIKLLSFLQLICLQ